MGRKTRKQSFPIEQKDKIWTQGKTYKNWAHTLKKVRANTHTAKEDLCVGKDSICRGNLGIPRKYMPQFTLRRAPFSQGPIKKFRKHIKDIYGVNSYNTTRKASELKPSQREISKVRVNALIEDNVVDTMEVPLVISKNDYVVDGHHRWAAFRLKAPEKPMKVVVIDAPVKNVLGMAVNWGASTEHF
jgi:hypothetical protein